MVLTVVLVALLAVAGGVVVHWVLHRWDGTYGRARRFPRVSVAVCLVAAAGCAVPLWLHDRLEHRLADVAGELVGARVDVHCTTPSETFTAAGAELGYVRWGPDGVPEHATVLAYDECARLRSWLGSDKRTPSLDEVVAVHVLTHESMHMAGRKGESAAECAAVQRDARTAELLGASPQQAATLAHRYWVEAYPRMPDDYRGGCGPGSAGDEHLSAPPW